MWRSTVWSERSKENGKWGMKLGRNRKMQTPQPEIEPGTLSKRGWCSTTELPGQATSPTSLFDDFIHSTSTSQQAASSDAHWLTRSADLEGPVTVTIVHCALPANVKSWSKYEEVRLMQKVEGKGKGAHRLQIFLYFRFPFLLSLFLSLTI